MSYSFRLIAQYSPEQQVDRLMNISKQMFAESNILKSLNIAEQAQDQAEKINYSKGITISNIHIANLLSDIGIYDQAFHFLKRVTNEDFFLSDIAQQAEFHRVRGRIYFNLRLYKLCLAEYNSTLSLSKKIKDTLQRDLSTFLSHHNLAYVFGFLRMDKQAFSHLKAQEALLKKFNINESPYSFGMYYVNAAQLYLYDKMYKQAKYNLDRAMILYRKYEKEPVLSNPSNRYGDLELAKYRYPSIFDLFNRFGSLELAQGNRDQALAYFKQALDKMLAVGDMTAAKSQYKVLADYYNNELSDRDQGDSYMFEYNKLNDSLDRVNKQIVEIVLDDILEFKDAEQIAKKKMYYYSSGVLFVIVVCVSSIFFVRNRRNRVLLDEQEAILTEKELLTEELGKQIEENKFHDLIKMVKGNNPEFIVLFRELYPDFVSKLKALDPKIRSTELTFCAMAYLNFSTKDIAEYTFVTIRAVQIRKNRLRKKYKISSEEDFNSWMRRL